MTRKITTQFVRLFSINTVVLKKGLSQNQQSKISTVSKLRNGFATLVLLMNMVFSGVVHAQVEEFYVPLPESSALDFFSDIATDGTAVSPTITRTDIVIRELGTEIIYDPSVNGYESQYTDDSLWTASTEWWGDGDCSNGFNPNVPACIVGANDALDVFTVGEVIVFDASEVTAADYFRSTHIINLTRSLWPTGTATFLAGAFELFPTAQWATTYVVPIGEDTASSGFLFEQVAVSIMAENDGTIVSFDPDGPGGATAIVATINRGESLEYGIGAGTNGQSLLIAEGAMVIGTAPIQVNVLTGDNGTTYEARFYTLFPNALLSNEYYEAVATTAADSASAVFLFNPNTASIIVDYYDNLDPTANPTSVTITAGNSVKVVMPLATANGLSGVRFTSRNGEIFSAYTVVDDESGAFFDDGTIHDWGHVTTPIRLMGDTVRVGFAPGNDPDSNDTLNASPIWVVADVPGQGASQDIEICVDDAGDGNGPAAGGGTDPATGREYDYSVTVQPLDSVRLYDNGVDSGAVLNNGNDQTGMLAFSCNTASSGSIATPTDVVIAAAWGQDPARTAPNDSGFDVGTTIRTGSTNKLFIGDLIFQDFDGDGIQDIGELGIANASVTITSTNPSIDVDPSAAGIQNTLTIQTDSNGLYLFTDLVNGEEYSITVTPIAGYSQSFDPDGTLDNTTTLTLLSSTLAIDFGFTIVLDIDKTSNTSGTNVDPGDVISYTIVVTNNTPATTHNVVLGDVLPAGVSYNSGTAMKTYQTGGSGTFTSPNLGPVDIDGSGSVSYTVTTSDGVPSDAILTDYEFNVIGTAVNGSFIDEIDLVATTPTSTVFNLDFGTDLGLAAAPGVYSEIQSTTTGGTALGLYQLSFSEDFDDAGVDNEVSGAIFTIDYTATRTAVTDAANDPSAGDMVTAADQVDLLPGESMTVTFDVTVGNPFIPVSTTLTNTASVTSDESTDPQEDTAVDEVNQPGTASIAGLVWLDEDQDGINDIEEAGLTNITVELQDGICTPLPDGAADCPTVLTDQYGNYIFSALVAGNYSVVVITSSLPSNLTVTAGQYGVVSRSVTLAADENVTDENFGYIADASTGIIGDRIWSDADADGIQDVGEAGIANVTLSLLNSSGAVIATTSTNQDGDYLFTNIPFGDDYVVVVDSADPQLTGPSFAPTVGPQSEGGYISNPVSLSSSLTTVTDVDFGFDSPDTLSITDRVWYDTDRDQTQGVGEVGIEGVTVDLLDSSGNVVATATTDSNGDFTFSGIPEGSDYEIQISDLNNELDGMVESTTTAGDETITGSLDAAANATSVDDSLNTVGDDGTPTFGYNNPGTIAGTLWSDADGNEVQNNGESGIGGITVTLTPPAGIDLGNGAGVAITTTTATDGSYIFEGLPPGSYDIDVLSPPAGVHTEDPDSDDDNNASVTLATGEGVINQDFGYMNASLFDITGTVFLDTDKDGVQEITGNDGVSGNTDDEPGFTGVSLDLIDCGTGTCSDGDEVVIATTITADGTTDANGDSNIDALDLGYYEFPGLPNGNYEVAVTDSSDLLSGYDITSGLDVLPVTVAGADENDIDFGYVKDEATGSISGEVFIDETVINGLADDNEANLSGVVLYLCSSPVAADPCDPTDSEYIGQTTTDANGEYIFTELLPDEYVVDADPTTIPASLTLTVDPAPVALSEGENITDVDVGYQPATNTGVLSGFVWTDVDSDGVHDSGEAPIAGVDVFVYTTGGTLIATATTKADGTWIVTGISGANLQDNLIIIYDSADIPADLESTQPTNLPLGTDTYTQVNLLSDLDNNISDLNFAFPPTVSADLGSIAGTIYSDGNQDGSYQSATDGELQGVTLNLLNSGGDIIATTSTDDDGNYIFSGLPDGNYTVVVSDLENVTQDLNPNETINNPITIAAGADIVDQDAGYQSGVDLGSIGNKFWFDTNGDGIQQNDEPGLAGVVIQVWLDTDTSETPNSPNSTTNAPQPGVDNLVRTVTTDENGEYYLTSLPAGQYIVVVFDSIGFTEGADGTTIPGGSGDGLAKPWTYALTKIDATPNFTADFGVTGGNSLSGKIFIEDEALVEPVLGDGDTVVTGGTELDGVTTPTGGSNSLDVSADVPAVGVEVILLLQQPDGSFIEVQTTTTDVNGDYNFDGLPDGNYRVEVQTNGSVVDGFGQTGDPDLVNNAFGNGSEDLVCDSPTSALCDDATTVALSGDVAVSDLNFGYQKNFTTTPVTVTLFTANKVGGGVQFNWESSNEVGHLGYQIYARTNDDWLLLNEQLISSNDSGEAMQTRRYEFIAYNTDAKWFALVDVSVTEELTIHGPFELNQSYGEAVNEPPEFDWNSLARPRKPNMNDSIQSRILRAQKSDTSVEEEVAEEVYLESAHGGDE